MERIYTDIIKDHLESHEQMVFIAGPRRIGKTTISLCGEKWADHFRYLNWDNSSHRRMIVSEPEKMVKYAGLDRVSDRKTIIVFDEIHKYRKWKNFLKGFFDSYKDQAHIIVTGSSKLNVFVKGGDSLMGRYFLYRIHPFSVAESLNTTFIKKEIREPKIITKETFQNLFHFGGFPEPFVKKDKRFFYKWKRLRREQLFNEDIRDLTRIQESDQLAVLSDLLKDQAGQLVNYTNLANKVNVSVDTIRRWINTLKAFYYCFTIKPWSKNISRSLIKEPKIYLWDWSDVIDEGAKVENFVASHLLKAIHYWTDNGFGDYELHFLRDKEKREVDFIVTKNQVPWFLVEVKSSSHSRLSKNLSVFQKQTGAQHAFQVVFDMESIVEDCFKYTKPVIVPAETFLSQLV